MQHPTRHTATDIDLPARRDCYRIDVCGTRGVKVSTGVHVPGAFTGSDNPVRHRPANIFVGATWDETHAAALEEYTELRDRIELILAELATLTRPDTDLAEATA